MKWIAAPLAVIILIARLPGDFRHFIQAGENFSLRSLRKRKTIRVTTGVIIISDHAGLRRRRIQWCSRLMARSQLGVNSWWGDYTRPKPWVVYYSTGVGLTAGFISYGSALLSVDYRDMIASGGAEATYKSERHFEIYDEINLSTVLILCQIWRNTFNKLGGCRLRGRKEMNCGICKKASNVHQKTPSLSKLKMMSDVYLCWRRI